MKSHFNIIEEVDYFEPCFRSRKIERSKNVKIFHEIQNLIFEYLLCYFDEKYKKEGKTGKCRESDEQLLGIRNLNYKSLLS